MKKRPQESRIHELSIRFSPMLPGCNQGVVCGKVISSLVRSRVFSLGSLVSSDTNDAHAQLFEPTNDIYISCNNLFLYLCKIKCLFQCNEDKNSSLVPPHTREKAFLSNQIYEMNINAALSKR